MRHQGPGAEDLETTRAVLAMCENIDWNVGRVLEKLNELKLAEQTIVLYFADNGPNTARWNGGMRGRKGSTDEGGIRAPLLIRWPGQIPAGTQVPQIAAAIDLLPTLAEFAEVKPVGEKPLDGISLVPLLRGTAKNWPDRKIFSHWAGKVSVRNQQYRLDNAGKLYDMTIDGGQKKDVAGEHAELASQLSAAVAEWRRDVLSELKIEDRPFSVGYREMPRTTLPARDGVPHGNVRRSSKAPNCSFFTAWSSVDDRITWDIEVATAGRYAAVVNYTCIPENVGATVELSLGDAKVAAPVRDAFNPPLRGAENDRAARGGILRQGFQATGTGRDPVEAWPRPAYVASHRDPRQASHRRTFRRADVAGLNDAFLSRAVCSSSIRHTPSGPWTPAFGRRRVGRPRRAGCERPLHRRRG